MTNTFNTKENKLKAFSFDPVIVHYEKIGK